MCLSMVCPTPSGSFWAARLSGQATHAACAVSLWVEKNPVLPPNCRAMPGSGTTYAHTWGGCWRKEGDLRLEYFPEGLILSWDCPNQIKSHDTFFRCVKCLWWIPQVLTSPRPCHTLCKAGRCGVLVRVCAPGMGACPLPIKPQML